MSGNNLGRGAVVHWIDAQVRAKSPWIALCAALALGAALALVACDRATDAEVPKHWPPGTVLAVEDLPITADEVDEVSATIAIIEPKYVSDQQRRLALTNILLPRAVARVLSGEARRDAALAEIERLRKLELEGGRIGPPAPDGVAGVVREGSWKTLGIVPWGAAMQLEIGKWSPVLEDIGSFQMVRPLERRERDFPAATEFRLDVIQVLYVPEGTGQPQIQAAFDRLHLIVVDPAWRNLVPEDTLYRMGVRQP